MRTCSIEGCDRTARYIKYCDAHYTRWYRNGDVRPDMPIGSFKFPTDWVPLPAKRCWQDEFNPRMVHRLYEQRDAARDERDRTITAWDGERWVLIR